MISQKKKSLPPTPAAHTWQKMKLRESTPKIQTAALKTYSLYLWQVSCHDKLYFVPLHSNKARFETSSGLMIQIWKEKRNWSAICMLMAPISLDVDMTNFIWCLIRTKYKYKPFMSLHARQLLAHLSLWNWNTLTMFRLAAQKHLSF